MTLTTLRRRFTTEPRTRIVAFGSSNTDRRITGMHWLDWLDLGIKQTFGRVHHCQRHHGIQHREDKPKDEVQQRPAAPPFGNARGQRRPGLSAGGCAAWLHLRLW